MPTPTMMNVKKLTLDLRNYRTPPRRSELTAVKAMIAVDGTAFWALVGSILDDGYHLIENIIVLRSGTKHVVREGNRRVAAIKLVLGLIKPTGIEIPEETRSKMASLSGERKRALNSVPCAVYTASESATVDKIVALTHGKGQKAGRTPWNAVAGARHNRDELRVSEPGLDLLEKYLKRGSNLTTHQKELWGGDYPLTVLDEAIKRIAPRLDFESARTLARAYPSKLKKAGHRKGLEKMLHHIGLKTLGFTEIRRTDPDFAAARYGFNPPKQSANGTADGKSGSGGASTRKKTKKTRGSGKPPAASLNDPKSVVQRLRNMLILGRNREKVEALRQEAIKLKLEKTPIAFCFLLRSMFEISAQAYCKDHKADGLSMTKKSGQHKYLVDALRDITRHLTKKANDPHGETKRLLHGAMAELATATSLLSVTSMNQLVHNPDFSVAAPDISRLYNRIAPLLETMNS